MQIKLHPGAVEDLTSSANWYSEKSIELGRHFCLAIDEAIEKIERDPMRFVRIDDTHQACSVTRFPFQVVYRCTEDLIVVVAIAHAKRQTGYWRKR